MRAYKSKYKYKDVQVLASVKPGEYINLNQFQLGAKAKTIVLPFTDKYLMALHNDAGDRIVSEVTLEELAILVNCANPQFLRHVRNYLDENEANDLLALLLAKKLENNASRGFVELIDTQENFLVYQFTRSTIQNGARVSKVLLTKGFVADEEDMEEKTQED